MTSDRILKWLLILLPFHVLLSVFLEHKIGIKGISIYKEGLLLVLSGMTVYGLFKKRAVPKFDLLDMMIGAYIAYLVLISLFQHVGLRSYIYGGRYDFEFLLAFLVIRHGSFLTRTKMSEYLRVFLLSATAAIVIGFLIRFVIGETFLVHFGFSPNVSVWNVDGSVPIYHGIPGANVRRFQGIFDGPNQAAFFLVLYAGILFHYLQNRKSLHAYLYILLFLVVGLIFMTYSRSSMLGAIGGLVVVLVFNFKSIFKKHRTQLASLLIVTLLVGGIYYLRNVSQIEEVMQRKGSSKGHYERMVIGYQQFLAKPFGSGLASSGPGYRLAHDTAGVDEMTFIPESWYVQQMVEGGFIGFLLFVCIMGLLAYRILPLSKPLFFSFVSVLIMNVFLHTFEASYISLVLFIFLGLFLSKKEYTVKAKAG